MCNLWRKVIPQRVSLVALAEGTPGANLEPGAQITHTLLAVSKKNNLFITVGTANPPTILGANVLAVSCKGDKNDFAALCKGEGAKKMISFISEFAHQVDVFGR